MALSLKGVTKQFGSVVAVDDVSLTIPDGQLVCFLGPSGCGKTTLLRVIAGFEAITQGRVYRDDIDITELPAYRRGFGMVFQSLALFPHLSVAGNIGYSLRIRGVDRRARKERVNELLNLVRMPGMGSRHVSQLSGGQRQRVAFARAWAQEPTLLLLDEPLSALDAKLRESMQVELRMLHERLKITTVLVTHDQREAITLSDQVVVMCEGRVEQVGTPEEIYGSPANTFVADFIGKSNLLPAMVRDRSTVELDGYSFVVSAMPENAVAGDKVTLSVRPEDVRLHQDRQARPNTMTGRIRFLRNTGEAVETFVEFGDITVVSIALRGQGFDGVVDAEVTVELPAHAARVLVR